MLVVLCQNYQHCSLNVSVCRFMCADEQHTCLHCLTCALALICSHPFHHHLVSSFSLQERNEDSTSVWTNGGATAARSLGKFQRKENFAKALVDLAANICFGKGMTLFSLKIVCTTTGFEEAARRGGGSSSCSSSARLTMRPE